MLPVALPVAPQPVGETIRSLKTYLAWAAGFSGLVNLLYLTPTLYMMQVYDRVVPTSGLITLLLVSLAALVALATLSWLDWLRGRILLRAGLHLEKGLARTILERIIDAPERARLQALREFDQVRAAVSGQGALALFDIPWTPIYLVVCFLLHPAIGALSLAGAVALFALAWFNERDSRAKLRGSMAANRAAYAEQETVANQSEVVRALGMRATMVDRQLEHRTTATAIQADAQLSAGRFSGAIKFTRLVLQSTALGVAALLVVHGQMSAGSIIASSVLLSRAIAPIELLVGAWPSLVQGRASWTSLSQLFAVTSEVARQRTRLPAPVGRIDLEKVSVQLEGSEKPQLSGVNLSLPAGQMIGVVGPSGSGKTTLARLLAGALRPSGGVVRIAGDDYDAWDSDRLAHHIGYLPQSPSLFAGSIRDNIARFRTEAPKGETVDEAVVAAAKAAGCHEVIQMLPKGYDTVLGPYGSGLSVGQAQRVAFARALFGKPVVLILDEPNAHLDHDGEAALVKALEGAKSGGATVIVIAHRTAVLTSADQLIVMNRGAVQTMGLREEVLARLRGAAMPAGAA